MFVDHLCHNTVCVNPRHLRVVTPQQNAENRSGAQSDSSSGLRGVYWSAKDKRWYGQVKRFGKKYSTPYFHTKEEANEAVIKLRAEVLTHSQN